MAEARTSKWYWNGKNYKSRALMMAAKNAGGDASVTVDTPTNAMNNWVSPAYAGAGAVHTAEPNFTEKFIKDLQQKKIDYSIMGDLGRTNQENYELAAYGPGGRAAFEKAGGWGGSTPETEDKGWFNKDNMSAFASGAAGLGSLASGWAALKNLKLSRQALENQQNQWQTDYESQRLTTNNAIANQNAWKQAQGRTDFGAYVGGKPPGTNYVG